MPASQLGRKTRPFLVIAAVLLLTGCEIDDELEIRADGSGTYRAKVVIERIVSPVFYKLRAEAERQGFRITEEGKTFTTRYMVLQKDFTDVRMLNGPQRDFDLKIEQRGFRRHYRLRATLGSFAGGSFERRFRITMPAEVKSTTAGGVKGREVMWYCSNGGSIDVAAESFHAPLRAWHFPVALLAIALVAGGIIYVSRRRQRTQERDASA